MATPDELKAKFWSAIASDRTMMVGVDGAEGGHARPMTAQFEGDRSPIWFFGAKDSQLVQLLGSSSRSASATFTAKGHDLFAAVRGTLVLDSDPAAIDRLWNAHVAAWYQGKDDPKLALLRLDADEAEIWLDGSSLIASIKILLGHDPKQDYAGNVATVALD
ncbi:pyridoxamine 5'-phosphate oxidase family protein [Novosphingobium sp.]|uniref:pyridoxamine 5'-phosphate oxidase family protein n=1 Tax=Novosphingobium sp. TaxID=1874826 RepID=UPI003BAB24B5